MSPGRNKARLAMYGAAHLIVDMCCFYILYAGVISCFGGGRNDIALLCFVMYNCAAFGAQVFFGRIADRKKNHTGMAELGCLLLSSAVLAVYLPLEPYTAGAPRAVTVICAITAAFGNALFHTGGGTDTLLHSEGKMSPNGFFVAPGAVGVAAGRLIGKSFGLYPAFCGCSAGVRREDHIHAAMMLAALTAYILCFAAKRLDSAGSGAQEDGRGFIRQAQSRDKNCVFKSSTLKSSAFIVCASVTVVTLRALVGAYLPVRTDSPQLIRLGAVLLPLIFALCAACGKALGGVLGDIIGARIAAVLSLAASAALFAAGIWFPAAVFPAVLLFNVTMPITLCAAAWEMPGRYGEAFGLTTFGLLIGSLPEYVIKLNYYGSLCLSLPLIIASAVLMYLCCGGKAGKKINGPGETAGK